MEGRLDRIERNLEEFLRGMAELRDFQKETGEQIRELREFQKETGRHIRESDERLGERIKEIDERLSQKMDRVSKELGEMGIIQGQIGEDLFYRNIPSV